MCNPALAVAGIQMAITAYGIKQKNDAASAMQSAQNAATAANYTAANEQEKQNNEAAALDKFERMRQGMREEAMAKTAAAESGGMGNSVLRQLADVHFQTNYDVGIIEKNRTNTNKQIENQKSAIASDAQIGYERVKSTTTNPFMAGLQIGTAGVSGYATGSKIGKTANVQEAP